MVYMFNKLLQTNLCRSKIIGERFICSVNISQHQLLQSKLMDIKYLFTIPPFFPFLAPSRKENKLRLKYNQDTKEAKAYILSQVMKSCLDFPKEGDAAPFVILSISIALQNFWISLTSSLDMVKKQSFCSFFCFCASRRKLRETSSNKKYCIIYLNKKLIQKIEPVA